MWTYTSGEIIWLGRELGVGMVHMLIVHKYVGIWVRRMFHGCNIFGVFMKMWVKINTEMYIVGLGGHT